MIQIREISKRIHDISVSKGFTPPNEDNFPEKIVLVHAELSEAIEAHRKDEMDKHLTNRKGIEVELADACIRIFHIAYSMNLDLGGAIEEKVEYNSTRDHAHGGKKY